jgi:hypothetical protein
VRSTRQGCARGQRHGTLDRDDPDLAAGGWSPWAAASLGTEAAEGRLRRAPAGPPVGPALGSGIPGWGGLAPETEAAHEALAAAQDAMRRSALEHARRVEFAVGHALVKAAILGWGVLVLAEPGTTRLEGDRLLHTGGTRVGPHPLVPPGTVQRRTGPGRVDPATGYWYG